jgi:ligand-binding sensor domain-containing protein
MSDLRTRIISALLSEDDIYLMADAVIRELEADYILVPKGHTIVRWRSPDYSPESVFQNVEVIPWKADDE